MNVIPVVKGLLTWIPGLHSAFSKKRTGGTDNASYCYEVWLKHLTMAWANGLAVMPGTLAELGPGDSLGTGLAAMLTGVDRYYALDVVEYSNSDQNLRIFDELVTLVTERAPRPPTGFPKYDRYLDDNLFPSHILSEEILERALAPERLEKLKKLITDESFKDDLLDIRYVVPWTDRGVVESDSVDMIVSQSVLEHVVDLDETYGALHEWLKPGGMMSHQIDFGSHGITEQWNGYRKYSEIVWKMIVGRRPYLINRLPCSAQIDAVKRLDLEIVCELKDLMPGMGISRSEASSRWKNITDEDLVCRQLFLQAIKSIGS